MRFMLLQNYGQVESDCQPMTEWTPGDIKAHIEFQQVLNQELAESGELVDAQGLAGPELAKFVVSDGASAPVITDGPFPEAKELLAGYRMVDVETALLDGLSERLGDHHRLHSVRAHLLDLAGDTQAAIAEFRAAAARTTNLREQHYLTTQAARLAAELPDG